MGILSHIALDRFEDFSHSSVPKKRGNRETILKTLGYPCKRTRTLVLNIELDFKRLAEEGKEYGWPRVDWCARCNGRRLWGHGYVLRYFDGCAEGLWMKRYRCPECKAVHTMRPQTHWRGFWAGWLTIVASLVSKQEWGRWLQGITRQRQQYWWKGYRKQAVRLGDWRSSVEELLDKDVIVSTHSTKYCETRFCEGPSHLIYAATPAAAGG